MWVYYFSASGAEQCFDVQSCYYAPEVGTVVSVHVGHGRMRDYRVEMKDARCVMLVATK